MRSLLALAMLLMLTALVGGQPRGKNPHVVETDPLPPEQQAKRLKLPPGFIMQLVAAEPKIKKPINIAFDALGRLWVTGSEEYPFPAEPGRAPKDKLVILEDFAEDGLAKKATVFAEGLNIPIGVLPLPDCKSAVVFSIPNIYLLADTDGDGKADKKDVLYSGYGYKDTHGMTGEFVWGFDGWIYCCHGFANVSAVKGKEGDKVAMQSGNTYRIKPDGSKIEQFTWGQVNPFGLAFDALGNLYSADCHSRPIYQLLKGGYYPSFGKPHDGLGFAPEMLTHDHGSTGIAGIACTAADHYPPEFRDNLFIGNPITNRINRDRLEWHGSSPKAIAMPDFVVSDDPWFRPVDIKLGPDGCLYVADFYNRIIGHYEVPLDHPGRDRERGRIWRIVYVGPDGKGKPNAYRPMPQRSVEEVVAALGDPNLAVRTFAANELVARGSAPAWAVGKALRSENGVEAAHALWVLERLQERGDVRAALRDAKDVTRVHAARILGERRSITSGERDSLRHCLREDPNPLVRRAAAEALGTHPDRTSLEELLRFRRESAGNDTHLLHTIRMAVRNQLRDTEVLKFVQRATWPNKADRDALSEASLGLPTSEAAFFLVCHGLNDVGTAPNVSARIRHVSRYGSADMRSAMLALLKKSLPDSDMPRLATAVKAMLQGTQERGGQLNDAERRWAEEPILKVLEFGKPKAMQDAIDVAGQLKLSKAQSLLVVIASARNAPEAVRKSAVAAVVSIEPRKHVDPLMRLLLDEKEPLAVREQVAASLAGTSEKEVHAALIETLGRAPAAMQTTIAVGMTGSSQGGDMLLEAVAAGKASARLLQDRNIEARLKFTRVRDVDQRLAKLTKGLPAADQRAFELMSRHRAGFTAAKVDAALGLKVFQKHCAACHQLKNEGSKIGPQLDGIGNRGLERLLEDIFDPNRNVDQAFRATTLELQNGQLLTGLLLREEGKVLVVADKDGKEVRVPGEQIAGRAVAQLSPMPGNFTEQIAQEDFYHLLAYLLEQRVK